MAKNKQTKKALLSSVLALLLCCSMLIGTTFAWFTDSVTSGRNTIQAGNLDVELEYWDGDSYEEVTSNTKLFNDAALWEPGHTEVAYLKVSNAGSLALKYQLAVNVYNEILGQTKDGDEIKLSDYLVFSVVEKQLDSADDMFTREEARGAAGNEYGLKSYNSGTKTLQPKNATNAADKEDYVALIIYMPEVVDNSANHDGVHVPSIEMGVTLVATQVEAESDSFGPDYDEDAWADGFEVYSAQDLQAAINNGETNIVLMDDIELNEGLVIPAPSSSTFSLRNTSNAVVLNLNGMKLTAGEDGYVVYNESGATLVITDNTGKSVITGVVYTGSSSSTIIDGGTYNPVDGGAYVLLNSSGSLTINKATVNGGSSYPIYSYDDGHELIINDVTVNGVFGCINAYAAGNVVINDGEFYMTGVMGKTSHIVYISGTTKATINGGTFEKIGDISMSGTGGGGVATGYQSSGEIVIYGGSFKGDYRDIYVWGGANSKITVYGGTYKFSPTSEGAKLADGFKAVKNNGKYIVASENAVANTDELIAAINAGQTEIELIPGDYTLRFTNNTSFNLNGKTIKGLGEVKLAISSSEAWYGRIQASNVTFENIHFTSAVGATGEATYNNCTFDSWAICASSNKEETYFNNCTINGCLNTSTDFSSGDVYVKDSEIAKAEYSGSMTMNFENCKIGEMIIWNANTNLTNCEVTTLDQSNVTNAVVRINGVVQAATQDALNNAFSGSNVNVTLAAGEYKMPSSGATGEVTISGTKDTVLDVTLGAYMESANVTIEGVTIKTSTGMVNGNGSDYAALYTPNVTYKNCTFVGPMRVGRDGAKFIDCTFTALGNDYIWTYGNDVTFEGCTFNTDGKAILIYSDGGNEIAEVTVKNCTFNSTKGAKAGAIANQNCAAIEIHNYGNGVNLVTEGNTYDSNFSGEWRIKTYETGRTKVFVNGAEYKQIAVDGKLMTIDADRNVTVNG